MNEYEEKRLSRMTGGEYRAYRREWARTVMKSVDFSPAMQVANHKMVAKAVWGITDEILKLEQEEEKHNNE